MSNHERIITKTISGHHVLLKKQGDYSIYDVHAPEAGGILIGRVHKDENCVWWCKPNYDAFEAAFEVGAGNGSPVNSLNNGIVALFGFLNRNRGIVKKAS